MRVGHSDMHDHYAEVVVSTAIFDTTEKFQLLQDAISETTCQLIEFRIADGIRQRHRRTGRYVGQRRRGRYEGRHR